MCVTWLEVTLQASVFIKELKRQQHKGYLFVFYSSAKPRFQSTRVLKQFLLVFLFVAGLFG